MPAGGTLKFAPGGYHLMCMEPSAQIKPGGKTKVALTFAGGASVTADFAVHHRDRQLAQIAPIPCKL